MTPRTTLLPLLALTLAGCDGCTSDATAPATSAASPASLPPPVDAPDGLAASLLVPRPDELLGKIRTASGASLLLPRTLGGLVANLHGLPIVVAELIDERLPVVGATRITDGGVEAAVAYHVRDPARLVTFVASGSEPAFDANRDGERTWLVPRKESREPRLAATLVLLHHYLVAASSREAALALGPYLTRTLARRPAPKADALVVTTDAAGPALMARADGLRALAERIPMPPAVAAFVDPGATAAALVEPLEGLKAGELELVFGPQALTLDGTFAAAAMAAPPDAPASPLSLPDDVVAVASWLGKGDDPAARAGQLRDAVDPSWEGGVAAVTPALEALHAGMGPRTTMALRCTGVGFTGLARGSVADATKLGKGLEDLAALREEEPVQKRLETAGLTLSYEDRRLRHVPFDVFRLRLEPTDPEAKKKPEAEVDFLYGVAADHWVAAAGRETVATIQRLEKFDEDQTLASHDAWKAVLGRLPSPAWATAVVDAQGLHACSLGKPGGVFVTPIAFGVGPAGGEVRLHLEIARPLLKLGADALTGL